MQKREMSHGPATRQPTQEQKKRINRISAVKVPIVDDVIRYGQDIDEDDSRLHTRGEPANQTASSLPRITSPREGLAIANVDNYTNAVV